MSRLNLHFIRREPQTLGADVVYYERIKAMLAIGNSGQVKQDCIVDTGAPLTLFPQRQWERFEKDIVWLYTPGSQSGLPEWLTKVTGLGADSVDCRIGKVKIQIIELPIALPPRFSTPVEVIAKFPEDNGAFSQLLLGIGGGAFANWKLITDPSNAQAWLEY